MNLYEILKNDISFELLKARHERQLRQKIVAEKCDLSVSEFDDLELGLKLFNYLTYERLLRLYKKRTAIVLEDKENA